VADEFVYQYAGPPVRSGATGSCVRTGFSPAGVNDAKCGAPLEAKQSAPVVQSETKPAPPPAAAAQPVPEFVTEAEPTYIVPPPPTTEVRTDDGITQTTRYYDEDHVAAAGDGILGTKQNQNFAEEVAAAEAQMTQRPSPPVPQARQPAPAVTAKAQPVPVEQSGHLTLDGEAYFEFNKHNLTPLGREQLDKLLFALSHADYDAIVITGHTDRLGTDAHNQKLSERRALEVKRYLGQKGVDGNKIQAKWVGAAEPVTAPGACDDMKRKAMIECLAPDRRVELEAVGMREK
jgi:OOP family OmpA-OmpF porin